MEYTNIYSATRALLSDDIRSVSFVYLPFSFDVEALEEGMAKHNMECKNTGRALNPRGARV